MRKYTLLIILIILISFSQLSGISGQQKYKKINFSGLKIYTEEHLRRKLDINNIENITYIELSGKIKAFYIENGFDLVKTYKVQETGDTLSIYIDEGQIGRIVFRGLNSIDTIKIKYDFNLKERIFNKTTIENEIKRLGKKYKFKNIRYTLVPVPKGDPFFQLDDINIPGPGTTLPFFDEYDSRYNLDIEFIRPSHRETTKSFTYNIRTSYTKGLIPEIGYNYPSLFQRNDLLQIGSSIGLFYGLDLKFKNPPTWKFIEVHSDYYFAPLFKEYFTPMASASAYYSRASRKDIGLLNYNYLQLKGVLSPGITFLKDMHIYAGLGGEKVYIYTPKIDSNAQYIADPKEQPDTWAVFESRLRLNLEPWSLKKTKSQKFETIYNYYFHKDKSFHELNNELDINLEFNNLDSFAFSMGYYKIWRTPPFYHEFPVSDKDFKGFMSKSYHSRNIIKISNEYKFSIYRDSYYIGIFTDYTAFEGCYILEGFQQGIVAGLGGHIIFLDQFEFNIYFGKDYLFSTQESQNNIYLNLRKKW